MTTLLHRNAVGIAGLVIHQWRIPYKKVLLQWRHNGRDGVSNHKCDYCLLNRLFKCRSKKTSKFRVTGLCAGHSPYKKPVTRKMFPFDDVIMSNTGHWCFLFNILKCCWTNSWFVGDLRRQNDNILVSYNNSIINNWRKLITESNVYWSYGSLNEMADVFTDDIFKHIFNWYHCVSKHDDVINWKHFPRYWPVTGEFPSQRPVTRSFDVVFDLRLNTRLNKQSRRRWSETPSRSLWRHCNVHCNVFMWIHWW